MLEFMVDQWSDNVITDIKVISASDSCPSGYKAISNQFQGQASYCYNRVAKTVRVGQCNKNNKQSNSRTYNSYGDLDYITGVGKKKMKKLDGKKICYARADDWDYKDIVKWRKASPKDKKCSNNEVLCGGTVN
jgi:hypothetical protein